MHSLRRSNVGPIGIRDAMHVALLASLCFATCKAILNGSPMWLVWVGGLIPALVSASLHWRFRLSLLSACAMLYTTAIAWGFVGGVMYSLHWIRTPHEYFERNSLGVEQPIRYGLVSAQLSLIAGFVYVAIYAFLFWLFTKLVLDRFTKPRPAE